MQYAVIITVSSLSHAVSKVAQVVENSSDNAGDVKDTHRISGSGKSPGGGHGNPFQYSYLDNPIDRGAWWAIVHAVAKSQTL